MCSQNTPVASCTGVFALGAPFGFAFGFGGTPVDPPGFSGSPPSVESLPFATGACLGFRWLGVWKSVGIRFAGLRLSVSHF